MNNSVVSNNTSDFGGGGIGIADTSDITKSSIFGNNASFSGGGISNSGFLTISNSSISGNSCSSGAVIENTESKVSIINCTIAHNDGGGIKNTDGILSVINSTISQNVFGIENLDGLDFFGIVDLQNTILALFLLTA